MGKQKSVKKRKLPDIKSLIFGSSYKDTTIPGSRFPNGTQGLVPVVDIQSGVIITEDGRYLKILEVLPTNFYLKSSMEQQNIIYYMASYLRIAPVSLQILVQTGRADIDAYCEQMQKCYDTEKNEMCRDMILEDAQLVNYLAANEAVTRKFYLIFQHEGTATEFSEIAKQLSEAAETAYQYLDYCGLEVLRHEQYDEFLFRTIYTAIFTPYGMMITIFIVLMYCLFTKKGYQLLSGYKTVRDKERGIEILPEGTHGTSGWMNKNELSDVLENGSLDTLEETLFGKLDNGEYVSLKDMRGMNKNIIIYGSPGTGKSRGFVMPFAMQAVKRGESLIMVDPKAEFYEMYSEFFREQGYTVCAYNLLDLFASDGWNCVTETANDLNLVQNVAEIIIRNTSSESEKEDFWAKAEKNLLMALLHYVGTMTYPGTDKLLPVEERSLGTIYKILSSTSIQELDAKFRSLPPDHPALPPYGIFRQAHKQIWGNIIIGLGNRLNVFQNKLVDDITKHHEIDLTLPGKRKCAYFCIISDQDSSLEFLSSMFFSLLFVKLFDFARSQPNRRLPVCVNVLMDEFCNISLLDSKKIFSVARSRNINIQAAIQSIAQIANRYPKNEWQEIIGDCDYQLFLGCNDMMTAEHISDQCGEITVRINNSMVPMTPLFSPVLHTTRPYTHNKTSTGRPLMMPDEVRRLPKDQAILLIRGSKPLKLYKITPDEHPFFDKLKPCKAIDYEPLWQKEEKKKPKSATGAQSHAVPNYQVKIPIEPEDDVSEEVQLDAEDRAPDKKISYQNAENYNYKKEKPKNI